MKLGDRLSLFLFLVVCLLSCTSNKQTAEPVPNVGSDVPVMEAPPASQPKNENLARRDEVEAMMLRGEYLHDGPSELSRIGDIDSVPAILVVLKKHPPYKNGSMVCTTAHALLALKELTGAYPGPTYEAWFAWWTEYKKNNPVSGRLEKAVNVTPG